MPLSCAVRPARSRVSALSQDRWFPLITRSPLSLWVHRCLRPAAMTPPYVPVAEVEESCAGAAVTSQPYVHSSHASVVAAWLMCVSPANHMSSFSAARYCFAFLDVEVTLP